MTYNELWHQLTPLYEPEEARAVVRELLDELFAMTLTDIVSGKVNELSAENQRLLEEKMRHLCQGSRCSMSPEWNISQDGLST